MKCIWDRIHVWLAANAPAVLVSLRPGATEEAIRAAERELGVTLPDDVRESYRIHDGQTVAPGEAFPLDFLLGRGWNSLQAILEAQRRQAELASHGDQVVMECTTSAYLVTPRHRPKWVPFVMGSFRGTWFGGLDMDAETTGRVISYFSESEEHYQEASSFREWLAWFVDRLKAGSWRYEAGRGLAGVGG